ncbi:YraN family protein [Sulfuriroseicoccus oceanibius]|uniref:UPF0102 protein G3M56_007945 n=1 Tax=Sulfuriroseicoccus oceanibius TaxID=2707525 RepID=A0A6B3L6Y4_9BACT|nr:YraN family protein [Sulfuriroseicoccus oceanibius]QQL43828.1 YraN family protein [Sulfuriroseicoccus oceanibius]
MLNSTCRCSGWSATRVGRAGERLAGLAVARDGGKVLYRNYRAEGGGEVDLVCRDGEVLAFVEVKTRTSDEGPRPAAAVNQKKQELIKRGAREWRRLLGDQVEDLVWRYDVVEVWLVDGERPRVNWLKGEFE